MVAMKMEAKTFNHREHRVSQRKNTEEIGNAHRSKLIAKS